QINRYLQKPGENALAVLQNLNRQFPGTPEILGLLSYGHAMLTSTDSTRTNYRRETEVEFARQALDLDPTNFDALTTLFYFYLNFADLRGKAQQVSEAALRYHPGNKTAYIMALRLLVSAVSSCEKLQNFIQSTPGSVFAADQLKAIKTVINHCNDPSNLASIEPGQEFYVNGVINFFALNDDRRFSTINDLAQRYRNQIVFNDLLQQQLAMGVNVTPDSVAPGSRSAGTDKQLWRPTLYRYINYQPTSKAPSQLVEFARNMTRNDANPYFVAALVLQSQTTTIDGGEINISTVLSDYLANVPTFTIEPQNNNETIGLLMLQYHTGHLEQSRHSATTLLNKLNQYQQQHPQAYQFWSLAKAQFIGALYAEKWVEAKQILNSGFAADEAYWQHDKALMQIVLAPWAGHPMAVDLVTRYLNRIEVDQERARQKFDLQ
ncbi:MAG: hypothetical protein MJK04_00305, partial [Psychrosphaera sp.]|nr:hypothetical protein [Psychrosphaera sp.]